GREALAAVVDRAGAAGERGDAVRDDVQRAQPGLLGFLHYPEERHIAQALVRVAAADVRVHSGEPHLLQAILLDLLQRDERRFVDLVPQQRVERIAFVVQRERVPRTLYLGGQLVIGQAEREDPVVDRARQLDDRSAVGRDGVPDADEADRGLVVPLPDISLLARDLVADRAGPVRREMQTAGQPVPAELAERA